MTNGEQVGVESPFPDVRYRPCDREIISNALQIFLGVAILQAELHCHTAREYDSAGKGIAESHPS